jgi:TolA-binding protein
MTQVDLHPDELLDPERRRAATPEDRARLEQHLETCGTCDFELSAKQDFGRVLEVGTADQEAAERIAARALAALDEQPATGREPPRRIGRTRRGRRLLLVAAIIATASVAGAASWYLALRVLARDAAVGTIRPTESEDAGVQEAAGAVGRRATPCVATPPPRPRVVSPPTVTTPEPPVEPPTVPTEVPPATEPRPHRPAAVGEPPAPATLETASEAFGRANEVRRAGSFELAATMYEELQERFPASREAQLSRVTLGRLLLDRLDQPERALAQFETYLASGAGNLAEEALIGRAAALERLGRAVEERQAWTELLTRYPSTAQAERARRRLAELGGETP